MDADDASTVMRHQPLRRNRAHLDDLIERRDPAHDPVARLLAAASAPAQSGELAGLDSAVAAFAAAPTGAVPLEEKIPMLKNIAGRLAAVKILAVAAGVLATGGVAFAAVSSNHPARPTLAGISSGAAGSDSASTDGPTGSSSATASGSATSGTDSSSGRPSHTATPSPSLPGLCTAWLAHPRDVTKMSNNPAFSVLIKAAGGTDAVNGYCTTLLASAHPSHPAHPTQAQNTASHPRPTPRPSHSVPTTS